MKTTVVDYLVKKLEFLGINHIFGLPGDYNFNILDAIIKSKNVEWINSTNELNAGYCADGYARMKGYGALVTTYGVGELSAINAIAGSYAESVPVIHIAGVPKTSFIKNKSIVHHNYFEADYFSYENMYKFAAKTTAYLNEKNAKDEIDRIIDVMVNEKLPVYVAIPVDVCNLEIDDFGFDKIIINKSDEINLSLVCKKIKEFFINSKNPIIFADYLVKRFNLQKELETIIKNTNTSVASFLMGKGSINEQNPNYLGVYMGNVSNKNLLDAIDDSDLIITLGFLNADLNTFGFSTFKEKTPDILIEKNRTIIKGQVFDNVLIQDVVKYMAANLKETKTPLYTNNFGIKSSPGGKIKIEYLLDKIQNFLDENDVFVMETGLMSLSGAFLHLKKGMEYISQTLWGSIGWATPAAFGVNMGTNNNVILFTGDGAHQLTVQELANFFEHDLKPVIFLLNNKGYTVERVLSKDPEDKFNDITNWNYSKILEAFSNGKKYFYAKAKTFEELNDILLQLKECKGKILSYIEIEADKFDYTKEGKILTENMKKYSSSLD